MTAQAVIAVAIVVLCGLLVVRGLVRAVIGRKHGCGCAECPATDRSHPAPPPPPRRAA
jgi:hypothetical protein